MKFSCSEDAAGLDGLESVKSGHFKRDTMRPCIREAKGHDPIVSVRTISLIVESFRHRITHFGKRFCKMARRVCQLNVRFPLGRRSVARQVLRFYEEYFRAES